MMIEQFIKDVENKLLSINEGIERSKSILERLRDRQNVVVSHMTTTVRGTKKFKELENIRITLLRLISETTQIQAHLIRKRNALSKN